ncbi:Protein LTV1-like protein [Aphelenchoides besseyi]|nr:Protein LTV1-like protein [Aphelenchoides besseyi]
MPRKKKYFINKNEKTTTYRLTSATEVADKPKPVGPAELVNVVQVTENELAEREKWGIYYDDNYDYLSHLKAKDEAVDVFDVQKTEIFVPKSAVQYPTKIIEVRGREIPLDVKRDSIRSVKFVSFDDEKANNVDIDVEADIDPEILAALELEDDCDNEDNELEDDFCALAGGFVMPEGRRIFEEIRKTAELGGSSDEDESDDDFRPVHFNGHVAPSRSILKQYTQTNPDKKELDERFNQFYANMENSDEEVEEGVEYEEEGDAEEYEYDDEENEIDNHLLDNFADVYETEKELVTYEKPDEESKRRSLAAYMRQETEAGEETEKIEVEVRSKKARWDCESIVSTYSNLYNHPTVIREQPKRKTAGLTKKDLRELNDTNEQMDVDMVSTRTGRSVCTVRSRGETTEERRERKKAVKDERRDRRQERKANRVAFKEEKKRMDAQRGTVNVHGRPIK